jgi:hypothetical protein
MLDLVRAELGHELGEQLVPLVNGGVRLHLNNLWAYKGRQDAEK